MALCVYYYQGVFFFFLVQLLHVPTLRAVFLLLPKHAFRPGRYIGFAAIKKELLRIHFLVSPN